MIQFLKQLFSSKTYLELAIEERDETRQQLLDAVGRKQYAELTCEYYVARLKQLDYYIEDAQKK